MEVETYLNLLALPLTVVAFCLVLPFYLFFKLLSFILRSLCPEDVRGKVVLITGASSGIGEHVSYEYARKGACLALAAKRENRLLEVADKAKQLGSPDVIIITTDITKVDHCQRMVDETIAHFGRVDHLVNNAGIIQAHLYEEYPDITRTKLLMEVNFWGAVYATNSALPHLKKSKGRIIVTASSGSWIPVPRLNIYNGTKGAMVSFFNTLRTELRGEVKITIVNPGIIATEMTRTGKILSKEGDVKCEARAKEYFNLLPLAKVEGLAKSIVRSACRGDRDLLEPKWMYFPYLAHLLCPEILEFVLQLIGMDLYNKIKTQL